MINKHKGLIFLWASILIFSAANSVIDKLIATGTKHLIHGNNPISFCNVLFVGNLIAGIVFLIIFRKSLHLKDLKNIGSKQWVSLSLITILSVILGPICIFIAIMTTQVINVILIGTTQIAWALILGYLVFKEKPTKLIFLSTIIALIGVAFTFYLHQTEIIPFSEKQNITYLGGGWLGKLIASSPKSGEISAFLGSFFFAMGDIVTKQTSKNIPENIYATYRTFIGAIIFFILALSLFGIDHFSDLFSPFLWEWMLIYGGVIVALGVYTWAKAAQNVSSNDLAISTAFFPIAGVFFAYIIMGEIPDDSQITGGAIILVGIFIGLYDNLKMKKLVTKSISGFKGI